MKNLRNLSEQELQSVNGGGIFDDLSASITGIVSGAINKNWEAMTKSIVDTVANSIRLVGSWFGR